MQKYSFPDVTQVYILSLFSTKTNEQTVLSTHKTKNGAQEAKGQFVFEHLQKKNGNNAIKNQSALASYIFKDKALLRRAKPGYYAYVAPKKNFNKVTVFSIKEVKRVSEGFIYNSETKSREITKKFSLNISLLPCGCFNQIQSIKPQEHFVRKDDITFSNDLRKIFVHRLNMSPVFGHLRDNTNEHKIIYVKELKAEFPDFFSVSLGLMDSQILVDTKKKHETHRIVKIETVESVVTVKNNIMNVHQQLAAEALEVFKMRQRRREEKLAAVTNGLFTANVMTKC